MSGHVDKEVRHLVRAAVKQGWTLDRSKQHAKLISPDGTVKIGLPTSMSIAATVGRVRSQLRQGGCKLP